MTGGMTLLITCLSVRSSVSEVGRQSRVLVRGNPKTPFERRSATYVLDFFNSCFDWTHMQRRQRWMARPVIVDGLCLRFIRPEVLCFPPLPCPCAAACVHDDDGGWIGCGARTWRQQRDCDAD